MKISTERPSSNATTLTQDSEFRRKVNQAFKPYEHTLDAVAQLLNSRHMAQEVIILVCARLDSLANLAFNKLSQEERFFRFIRDYSGQAPVFESVSLPDLYFHLRFQQEVLPGTIAKPGRIHIFTEDNMAFVRVLWRSDLAITVSSAASLLEHLHNSLTGHYNVQSMKNGPLPRHAPVEDVVSSMLKNTKGKRLHALTSAKNEISALVERFQMGRILYRDYRCNAIHEYGVSLDEDRFFSEKVVYWRSHTNAVMGSGDFMTIEFPGLFLRNILEASVRNYKRAVTEKRRLPSAMYNSVCEFLSDLRFLDVDSIEEGKDITLNLARG